MKDKGINIIGPKATSFHLDVNERVLTDYVLNNMNTYWLNQMKVMTRLKKLAPIVPKKIVDLQVQWSITGMLRQLYTLKEHEITSKVDACNYAINYLPDRHHNIIKEAISIREGLNVRYCHTKKQRVNDTIQCMNHIFNYCNSMSSEQAKLVSEIS